MFTVLRRFSIIFTMIAEFWILGLEQSLSIYLHLYQYILMILNCYSYKCPFIIRLLTTDWRPAAEICKIMLGDLFGGINNFRAYNSCWLLVLRQPI